MTLKQQTVSGVKWLVGTSFLAKGISFTTTIVLARMLAPAVFGLYSLAFVALDALGLFKSMGFDSALIQRKDNIEKAADTAFFIILLLGAIICFILVLAAPAIGSFLNNKEVTEVIRVLAIVFLINCFGIIPRTLLEKNMQFKRLSMIDISTAFIYSITAIILAISGAGIWSLVVAYMTKTLYQNIMFWVLSKWHPRFQFDKFIAFEMFDFGKFLFLGGLVWFLKMNLDNLLVGKLLGVTALGLYAIAFNIANFSSDYFGAKIQRVLFPAYSKLRDDLTDLKSSSLRVFKHISLFTLPFGIAVFLLGPELLKFFYGEQWLGASDTLKILSWAGIFNALPAGLGVVFLAVGKPKIGFWITVLQVILFFTFFNPMINLFGINGIAIVVSASSFIAFIIALIWAMRILSIDLKHIYLSLKPSLISSLTMAAGIIILKYILLQNNPGFSFYYSFFILSLSALAIYALSLFKIERAFFKDLKEIALQVR